MAINTEQLQSILVDGGVITPESFDQASQLAQKANKDLEIFLVENGYLSDQHLGQLIANNYRLNYIDIRKENIDPQTLKLIPKEVAEHQQIIAFKEDEDNLYVATPNPENYQEISILKKYTGKDIKISYTTALGIKETLKSYKANIDIRIQELLKSLTDPQSTPAEGSSESAITQIVDLFLEHANDSRASDIHLEPMKDKVSLRFRIDGVLQEILTYPIKFHENIVSRIKILSKLLIDEHQAAQDGRFSFTKDNNDFDVRVSILPTTKGENIVMRLLAESSRRLFVEDLGLAPNDLAKLQRASQKPYGMILAVGPTGAGKTTTLYSILHILNRPEVNIMTIEDPVENEIEEVRQTQVNKKKDITFATGLRSIVRQDPDIIMVGEIRDEETASIAVNSAMTGHLVLSTLHSNDAATTFPRLLEMRVEPFLVSSSVSLIIAQRLVRTICEKCRQSYVCSDLASEILENEPEVKTALEKISGKNDMTKIRIYKGQGCKYCNNTGYSGRTGIFEVLEVTEEIKSLIAQKATATEINNKALELGMSNMLHDGIAKMLQGTTTLTEVVRATKS